MSKNIDQEIEAKRRFAEKVGELEMLEMAMRKDIALKYLRKNKSIEKRIELAIANNIFNKIESGMSKEDIMREIGLKKYGLFKRIAQWLKM